MRIFQPALAGNALFGIVLGGVLAAIVGALLAGLLLTVAHAITPKTVHTANAANSEDSVDAVLGIYPLHSPFRDSLQLFLVMHGTVEHSQFVSTSSDGTSTDTNTITSISPLNGLLAIPALLLILGGYIAASTDFQNNKRSSLLRGAAIAIPYTILLLIMVSQVNGCIPFSQGSPGSIEMCADSAPTQMYTLSMDIATLIVFGLLWGGLFGLVGASLKLGHGQWRHMILQYLRTTVRPQIAGMITGGVAASALGLSLSLLVLFSVLAYTSFSTPLLINNLCYSGDWQILTFWGIAQGPLHAVNLFFFSFGAPIKINLPQPTPCFYVNAQHTTLSLLGGGVHPSPWTYTLLALPVISLFLGGRISAAIGRVQGIGPGVIQGALIALPFTVLMMLLTLISTVTNTFTSSSTGSSGTPLVQSAGVGAFDLLLWALLSSAVLGALGGMYQTSTMRVGMSRIVATIVTILELLGKPVYLLLDRLTGQPRLAQRSHARSLLYTAVFFALLLAIVAGGAGGILIASNQTVTFNVNYRVRDIISTLLIALPGLFLVSACAAALSRDPLVNQSNNIPMPPFQRGV